MHELSNKVKQSVEKHKSNDTTVIISESNKKNNRVIKIGDIKIDVAKNTGTRKSTLIHRSCLCWSVRGHARYYKSGKVVYIKPYKKGINRLTNEAERKTYMVISQ